ncbi:MAG: DEAD/DEAH box helicase, partial [Deltaproteobacteria bacterium]|nr:DEAD/DEAH box helicase [Deltaproteobacteria bacterium]
AVLRATLSAQGVPIHDLDSRWQRRARLRLTAPQLRDYQGAALAAWEAGGQRGVVMLPTGSGKTRVAIAAIAAVGRPTLILVPTRSLLAQWVEALSRIRFHPPVSRFGDGTHDLGPLTVATFAAAERHGEELGERFHLLVVDEAHHLAGPVQGELLELFVAPLRLGLTATPPSLKDDSQGAGRLERRVGPIVYRERTSALIDAGHLAGFDVQRLVIELTPGERATYQRCREVTQRARVMMVDKKGVLPDWKTMAYEAKRRGPAVSAALREAFAARRELRQVVGRAVAKRRVAGRLLDQLGVDGRTLIFCADNEATYALARELLVPAITWETTRSEREALFGDFRAGRVRVLVSARVLGEGVDLPEANAALVLGSAAGGSKEPVQRLGRLLRPHEGKRAVVYEVVARGTFETAEATARQLALVR